MSSSIFNSDDAFHPSRNQAIGEAFVKHLSLIGQVSEAARQGLLSLKGQVCDIDRGTDLLHIGDKPTNVVVVLQGMLQRYTLDAEGHRQIHSFYLANEVPSLESLHIDTMDNTLGAVTPSTVGLVPHADLFRLMDLHPSLTGLFWRETLIQGSIYREWLMRNSQKVAPGQMAHLFCEMFMRSKLRGLHQENSCALPITQEDLGAALGMSSVHVNRTLMMLRSTNLVEFRDAVLTISDFDRLAEMAGFDPGYLHIKAVTGYGSGGLISMVPPPNG